MAVERDITWNIRHFQGALRCDRNFDVVYRVFRICGREACMFFVDGFAKDEIMEKLLEFFYGIQDEDLLRDAHTFSKSCVPYCEVAISGEEDTIVGQILSGVWAVFVDGMDQCVLIDQRTYPQRTTSEPDQDKSFRGSRDGFVETMVFNAALIRRRIRSPRLCVEHLEVGETSRTDVAVCYFEGRADPELVNTVRERIAQARVDALTMNQESLAELLVRKRWYNPFPKFKFTERPDAAAAQILEGDVVVLVDNSPAAIILPTTLFDVMEEANDYYFPPITGSYLRLVRFFTTFLTTFLTPVWLLLIQEPERVPGWLEFILMEEPAQVPPLLQLLILELAIDGLKLAALNTPNILTTSFSMIGAIILGDFAVQSGWFSAEVMLYMAVVAIANYNQPNLELGYALKFMRLILLVATGLLGLWGFVGGAALLFLVLVSNRTISGQCYLYPLVPFNGGELKKKLLRIGGGPPERKGA
ncbi:MULTISPECIES: spore germination protein [Clostridium]|nr:MULTISPECIES: spore germination protein [Clostridium]MBP8859938.1 spore germination protein [Lawsonibacter sp.]MBS5505960.1 spore germination protein [Oscillospiraceae bacterium]MCB5926346.1 spore germination protein [bacterium 210820-DFI.5.26]